MLLFQSRYDREETTDWIWWIATNKTRDGVGRDVTLKRASRGQVDSCTRG
jgi:hypothetical protein